MRPTQEGIVIPRRASLFTDGESMTSAIQKPPKKVILWLLPCCMCEYLTRCGSTELNIENEKNKKAQ